MSPLLTGAWEWLSERHDGKMAFTDRHFCYASAPKNRFTPQGDLPSGAEAAALYRTFGVAVVGSLAAKQTGDEWLLDRLHTVDLDPGRVGVHEHNVVWVEGDYTFNQGFGPDGSRGPVPAHQCRKLSQLGSSSWAGTWELKSDEWASSRRQRRSKGGFYSVFDEGSVI